MPSCPTALGRPCTQAEKDVAPARQRRGFKGNPEESKDKFPSQAKEGEPQDAETDPADTTTSIGGHAGSSVDPNPTSALSQRPPGLSEISSGATTTDASSVQEQDTHGLSAKLIETTGTRSESSTASTSAAETRAERYALVKAGQGALGDATLAAGVVTVACPVCLPVTAVIAGTAKVAQFGLAIAQVVFAPEGQRLSEAVEVGASLILGRAASAGAGKLFQAASRTGIGTALQNQVFRTITPVLSNAASALESRGRVIGANLINNAGGFLNQAIGTQIGKGVGYVSSEIAAQVPLPENQQSGPGAIRAFFDGRARHRRGAHNGTVDTDGLVAHDGQRCRSHTRQTFEKLRAKMRRERQRRAGKKKDSGVPKQGIQTSEELSALMDSGVAFVRTALIVGTNIAGGLEKGDPDRFKAAQAAAEADFAKFPAKEKATAKRFFKGCIFNCGKKTQPGVPTGTVELKLMAPLVIDLEGNGVALIPQKDSPVFFDSNNDGTVTSMSWIFPDDGFLVRDVNRNRRIDDASELFTASTSAKSPDGFAALKELDLDGSGYIDYNDPVWPELLIWRDYNLDGRSEFDEFETLDSHDITRLPVTKIVEATSANPEGDFVLGAAVLGGQPKTVEKLMFEVGLNTVHDPKYIRFPDLDDGTRRCYGKDFSLLYVNVNKTKLDMGKASVTAVIGSPGNDHYFGSTDKPVFVNGGLGDDVITGGDRPDMLRGGQVQSLARMSFSLLGVRDDVI